MSVMVYSQLGDLLRVCNLTVSDLQHQIAARFGLTVHTRTLDRLARAERVRRPDLEIAAAAAEVLGVNLNDVFAVEAIPFDDRDAHTIGGTAETDALDQEQGDRLHELFALQNQRPLSADERAELTALVDAYGRSMNEQGIREIARRRGVPVEQVRMEVLTGTDQALAWWHEVEADPARLEHVICDARERQRARTGT